MTHDSPELVHLVGCNISGDQHRCLMYRSNAITPAHHARLAQSVEHETLNLRVVGSSPTLGTDGLFFKDFRFCKTSRQKKTIILCVIDSFITVAGKIKKRRFNIK